MRKILAAAVCLAFAISANAQDRENKDYKLIAPAITAETQWGPQVSFGNVNVNALVSDLSFKMRYFATQNFAIRLKIGIASNDAKTEASQTTGTQTFQVYQRASTLSALIGLGAEYHFKGTKRLSPYVGLDAGITFGNQRIHQWNSLDQDYFKGKNPRIGCKIAVFTGADIYLLENFYVGLEIGIAYEYIKTYVPTGGAAWVSWEQSIGGVSTAGKASKHDYTSNSGFDFGMTPALRIGWKF
ncbi:MAG: outer membrane beta-barrel protein [Bacteroidales bacterium]|jgi:outer membrane protein W|nr:outer membrane beta-barrel protein [Bacteroidales bacterium]